MKVISILKEVISVRSILSYFRNIIHISWHNIPCHEKHFYKNSLKQFGLINLTFFRIKLRQKLSASKVQSCYVMVMLCFMDLRGMSSFNITKIIAVIVII